MLLPRAGDKMTAVKLKRIGNSVGVIIPRDVLARMTFDEGDTLFLTETPGGYRRTPYEPEFGAQWRRRGGS
jgi:putative addiction module antidote